MDGYKRFHKKFHYFIKQTRKYKIVELERLCQSREQTLKNKYSATVEKELKIARAELNDLLRRKVEFILHRVRQKYYFNGSRPSKILALKLKQSEHRATIDAICSPCTGLVSEPNDINDAFKLHFSEIGRAHV